MNKLALCTLFCSLASGILAAPNDGWNENMTLFKNGTLENTEVSGKPTSYRIPAITTTAQGTIVAVSDVRYDGKHGNTDITDGSNNIHPVKFSIKVSHDGGNTWSEEEILAPESVGNGYITDPSIVHNPDTGRTFIFGYQNDKHLTNPGGNNKFIVFSSDDGGKTRDNGQEIQNSVSLGEGYKYTLQGPGSGLHYNGTTYMAIQGWKPKEEGKAWQSVSGFIYSNDNGKTWQAASLINALPKGVSTSESNIFYHKGKICVAAKVEIDENNAIGKSRVAYTSSDNGKTWERLDESFLPDNIAKCESSSLSLSDDVYLVGYALQGPKPWDRDDIYLTTNTGKKIKLFDGANKGYTSLAQDLDNLYVLFEGNNIENDKDEGDMLFRRFDISAKEYANVNAQIYKRAHYLNDIQNKLLNNDSYVSAEYGSRNETNIESILALNNFKFGAFYRSKDKNSEKVYRTIEYKSEDATFTLSKDNLLTKDDNLFIGYQYGKIKYKNGSKNDVNSIVAGYGLNHEFANNYGYNMEINGIYSYNHLKRNEAEGLGKSADFKSYSALLKNEFYKNMSFENKINSRVALGLKSMVFGHDKITEKHGNDFNDATVKKSNNFSNEIYANIDVNKDFLLTENLVLNVGASSEYKKELNNVDDWKDKFIILDVEKDYAAPVKKYKDGVVDAKIYTSIKLNEDIEGTISFKMDSTGEKTTTGKLSYKF